MGGGFPMDTDSSAIREWAERAGQELMADPSRYTELWDLDEIFWNDYPRPWDLGRAVAAFVSLIDCYVPWRETLFAGLQICLRQVSELAVEVPRSISLDGLDVNQDHPPAIFLAKNLRPPLSSYELYRAPVAQTIVKSHLGQVEAYYECFRTRQAIEEREPYDRVIVIRHQQRLITDISALTIR